MNRCVCITAFVSLAALLVVSPFAAYAQAASDVAAADVSIHAEELPQPIQRPAATAATETFVLDGGVLRGAFGVFRIPAYDRTVDGLWLNRFTVGRGVSLKHFNIFWPPAEANVDPTWQVGLVAYYDADMDGDPGNAVRLGSETIVTVGALAQWKTYPVNFTVPAAGDFYIGFVDLWARVLDGLPLPLKYIASIDDDNPQCRSYMLHQAAPGRYVDYTNLGNNDVVTILIRSSTQAPTNLMIRADGDPLGGDAIFQHGFDNLLPCGVAAAREP